MIRKVVSGRTIVSGNETMAAKMLQMNIDEIEFKKELAILKPLEHVHVCFHGR